MEELLKKLLAADILNEDTKVELEAAFQTQLSEAVDAAKAEASAKVQAELTEQWITERDALIEAIDTKVNEFLGHELEELKEDIDRFRDLEAEHAANLVEAKEEMATVVEQDMASLVEKLNTFLEMRITSEMDELKDDLQEAKKLQFGKEIFEGFAKEFSKNFIEEGSAEAELAETKKQLDEALKQIEEAEQVAEKQERSAKLNDLLESLEGKQRDVMEAILRHVPTAQLDEGYKTFIGRVIKTEISEESSEEKEGEVLAEGDSEDKPETDVIEGKVVTGDTEENVITENADEGAKVDSAAAAHLRKLAGITQ